MKKLIAIFFLSCFLSLASLSAFGQLYGLCVWEKSDEKVAYVSHVFEYKEDAWTGYSTSNTALKCSVDNALKIELGSKYKNFKNTLYLRKDRNLFYPYSYDEAKKLRTKLISDLREKDYTVYSLEVTYDRNACN